MTVTVAPRAGGSGAGFFREVLQHHTQRAGRADGRGERQIERLAVPRELQALGVEAGAAPRARFGIENLYLIVQFRT